MAGRKRKETADWFPHDTRQDDVTKVMDDMYGNDGYVFLFRLRETLGDSPGHFLDWRIDMKRLSLISKCHVAPEIAEEMMTTLMQLGYLDRELWGCGIAWSDDFVNSVEALYRNRESGAPERPKLRETNTNSIVSRKTSDQGNLQEIGIKSEEIPFSNVGNSISDVSNTTQTGRTDITERENNAPLKLSPDLEGQNTSGQFDQSDLENLEPASQSESKILEWLSIQLAQAFPESEGMADTQLIQLIAWMRSEQAINLIDEFESYTKNGLWQVIWWRFKDCDRGEFKDPAKYLVTGIVSPSDPYLLKPTASEESVWGSYKLKLKEVTA